MEDGARKNAYLGINWKWDSTFSSTTDVSVDPCAYFVGTGSEVVKGGPCVGTIIKNTSGSTKTLYFRPHIKSTNASYTAVWGSNATYYPNNYLIIRPSYIAGKYDDTNRFDYSEYPQNLYFKGDKEPLSFIDGNKMAEQIQTHINTKTVGTF